MEGRRTAALTRHEAGGWDHRGKAGSAAESRASMPRDIESFLVLSLWGCKESVVAVAEVPQEEGSTFRHLLVDLTCGNPPLGDMFDVGIYDERAWMILSDPFL